MRIKISCINCLMALCLVAAFPQTGSAAVVMDCEGTIQSWITGGYYKSGDCYCSGGKPVCTGGASKSSSSKGHSGGMSIQNSAKLQVMQGIFDGLANSLIGSPHAKKQMRPLAPVTNMPDASQDAGAENIQQQQFDDNKANLLSGLKGIDSKPEAGGSAEALAANARKPFDTGLDVKLPDAQAAGGATSFFGDTMPLVEIQLLVHPENDPRVVDLRNAQTYVVDNIKSDDKKFAATMKAHSGKENGEPIIQPPACSSLTKKMNGLLNQRNQFQKTVNMAQEQLATWESANRNALLNAAKDGLEYFTGQLLEGLAKRGEAAERLQNMYNRHSTQMARDGLDVAGIEAKIKRLRKISAAGQLAESASTANDWQATIKDGASSLLGQMTSSNKEIQQMLADPRMQKYLDADTSDLQALLDISKIAASNKVFGKWVAKKIPVIAAVELGINQTYNALDWSLSFYRIIKDQQINGKVLDAARLIQSNIDKTNIALKACR